MLSNACLFVALSGCLVFAAPPAFPDDPEVCLDLDAIVRADGDGKPEQGDLPQMLVKLMEAAFKVADIPMGAGILTVDPEQSDEDLIVDVMKLFGTRNVKIVRLEPSTFDDVEKMVGGIFQQFHANLNIQPQLGQNRPMNLGGVAVPATELLPPYEDESSSSSSSEDKMFKKPEEAEDRQPFLNANQIEGLRAKGDRGDRVPVRHVINFLPRDSPKDMDFIVNAAKRRMNKRNGEESGPMVMMY